MMGLCLLAVDDESLALSDLTAALQTAEPAAAVHAYTDPTKALEAVRTGEILPDIAFLDIQMRGWTGLDLALELKKTIPALEIIFVTAYSAVCAGILFPPCARLPDEACYGRGNRGGTS